jgi:hypothetical protein
MDNEKLTDRGTSLAIRQFCAAAFGWVKPHSPSQPWRVVRVTWEERYCMGCFDVRKFVVIEGEGGRSLAVCRVCGEEVRCG